MKIADFNSVTTLGITKAPLHFSSVSVVKLLRCLNQGLPRRVRRLILQAAFPSAGRLCTLFARLWLRLGVEIAYSFALGGLLATTSLQTVAELVNSSGLARSEALVRARIRERLDCVLIGVEEQSTRGWAAKAGARRLFATLSRSCLVELKSI